MIYKFSCLHFVTMDEGIFRSEMKSMRGKKIEFFGRLAKDIQEAAFDKYGLAFNEIYLLKPTKTRYGIEYAA